MNIYYLIPPRKEWIISRNVEHKIKGRIVTMVTVLKRPSYICVHV